MTRDWMTVKEAAEHLGVCRMTVHRYIKDGKLQTSQVVPRGKNRVSVESINRLTAPQVRART